jgi:hypothetical protein
LVRGVFEKELASLINKEVCHFDRARMGMSVGAKEKSSATG